MKRIITLFLAVILVFSMIPAVFAADAKAIAAADELNGLGLFQGTGTDSNGNPIYELDRAPSRYEAVTMLVRLLGKETEAKAGKWNTPFTDVVDWAKPYVGYAYANKLTAGTGGTTFGGDATVTATQYLTFVLRALGYDSSTDFKWDAAWELSDQLGFTHGEYSAKNNGDFLRGHVVVISRDALSVCLKGTSTKLIDTIEVKKPEADDNADYSVDYSGAIPAATGSSTLSSAQLKALAGKTPEQAAATVKTLADAYAWLKQEGYSTTGMSGLYSMFNGVGNKDAGWVEMATVLNVLLKGDYDEVGTYLITVVSDDAGWDFMYMAFNYVKAGDKYYVTDPLCQLPSTGWACCRAYTIEAGSLSAVKNALTEINGNFRPITLAAYPLFTGTIQVSYNKDPLHITFPEVRNIQYLFHANAEDFEQYEQEKEASRKEEMERWGRVARTINISNYNIPAAIGQHNLTYDQALALVGQDPQVIANSVKSVADALQYMIASRFGYYSDYFGTPWYGYWGFDAPGDYQISVNYGCCCGGYANAASFLLQGDFEKVGTLRWVGGGNHTISWVYTDGKYYVFDFTQYCSGGSYSNFDCPVTVLDRLEDFYDQMPDTYSYFPKSEVVLMVAFEAGEAMYPSHWQDPPRFTGLTFPKEAEGKITVIYQKDPRYGVEFKTVDTAIPGWNS